MPVLSLPMQTGRRAHRQRVKARSHRPDYALVIVASILLTIGLVVVYSIGPGLAAIKGVGDNYYVGKQIIAIAVGLIVFTAAAKAPLAWWPKLSSIFIAAALFSVGLVAAIGEEVYGAARWVQVGGFSFQSAELIKFSIMIALAEFLARRRREGLIGDTRKTVYPLVGVVILVGALVAGLQSDLGSSSVMIVMIGMMAITAGIPLKKIGIVGLITLAIISVAVISTPYRRARVTTFLHPSSDCQDEGYQSCQALIAIGSGGVIGKGLGNSIQAYGYLPEAANDSIFAIIGEKFGFLGSAIVVMLYGIIFSRLKRIVNYIADDFQRFVGAGLLAWLSTQAIINIAAMIGLLPLKGITLPFISYGGTSLLFVMAALGVVFSISRFAGFQIVPLNNAEDNYNDGVKYDNSSRRRRVGRPYNPKPRYRPSA